MDRPSKWLFPSSKRESQEGRINQSRPYSSETSAGELRTGSSRISSCSSERSSRSDSSKTWRPEGPEDLHSSLSSQREKPRSPHRQMAKSLMEETCPLEFQSHNLEDRGEIDTSDTSKSHFIL